LIGYKDNKNNENLLELKEEMDMLDYCINILPEEEKTIITNHYIKRMSLRQLSKVLIMARTTITRKLKNAENLLEKLLKSAKN
jgi:RNA polymerase sigma factor (sigma-70 family)